MKKEYAKYLLKKGRYDYNSIAHHFAITRNKNWEELRELFKDISDNDKILDLGCGNGRLLEVLKNIDYIGVDSSEKLIEIAQKKYPQADFQVADALNLPFPDNYFDKVYSIAVLHHIPSKKYHLQFLKEAKRVLKPDGILVITVWNLWQKKFWKLILKYTFLKLTSQSKLDFKDIFYPWKNQKSKTEVLRYFHCFTKKELIDLAKKIDFKIKKIGNLKHRNRSNLCLIAQKTN